MNTLALGTALGDPGYSADAAGLVEAIDSASGAVRWTATLPAKGTGLRPAIGPDGTLYVGTTGGRVVQIR